MTKRIQEQILRISSKIEALKLKVQELREENSRIADQLKMANERQGELQSQLTACQIELAQKEEDLTKVNEQTKVSSSAASVNREEEIDELVKEIEFCIAQLKR